MKMKYSVLLASALASSVGLADEIRVQPNSNVMLKGAGLEFGVSGFLPGWIGLHPRSAGIREKGTFPFMIGMNGATAYGKASFVQLADGKVSARWFLSVDRPVKLEQLYFGTTMSFGKYAGGAYEINGKKTKFPKVNSKFLFGQADGVEKLGIYDNQDKLCCQLEFDTKSSIMFQDNSRFGGGFSVRIFGENQLEPGRIYEFGATISGDEAMKFVSPQAVKLTAGNGWLPFSVSAGVKPGSALDFSKICGIDAPAGKYGRVVSKGASFEFADRPGVKQRFYGVNLCFAANYYQSKEEADRFAAMLARLGYNAVRLHHHDGLLVDGSADGTTINPKRMDELDALVAAMIEHGIYVTTDLYVSRKVPWRQVGVNRDGNVGMQDFKNLVRTNEVALANLLKFSKAWLTHVNPYTGKRWADEPGIAWISLVNENCADNSRGIPKEQQPQEIAAEDRFFAAVKKMIREELKSEVLLTDLNGWSTRPIWSKCREKFDYVDMHFYVDHPRFLEHSWRLPSECGNSNPLKGGDPVGVSYAGACQLEDKPFTITEWNFSGPGKFRGVGGIVTGAWAAKHDWDGLWRFAWSHGQEGVRHPEKCPMDYFNVSGDPLMLASERATMCLFLRRDIEAGDRKSFVTDPVAGTMTIDTARTCGAFAESGKVKAGLLSANLGEVPATVWVSSLDGKSLAESDHLLFTHLTDVQNSGATYADDSLRILTAWGKLPHLMREGRAEVTLKLSAGDFEVYVLDADGTRREKLAVENRGGELRFVADVGRNRKAASYLYEIVRK